MEQFDGFKLLDTKVEGVANNMKRLGLHKVNAKISRGCVANICKLCMLRTNCHMYAHMVICVGVIAAFMLSFAIIL